MTTASSTLNPIRSKAKGLLRKFLDRIDEDYEKVNDIPEISNGQWRTVSAVLASYRMFVDEDFAEEELKLAKLDYSKLSIEELHILVARFKAHPQLAGAGTNGKDQVIEIQGGNGDGT